MSATLSVGTKRRVWPITLIVIGVVVALMTVAVGGSLAPAPAQAKDDPPPPVSYSFVLEAGGGVIGTFDSATGIGSMNEVILHRVVDSSGREITRKIPGKLGFGDIVLTRPLTTDRSLWEWRTQVETGDMAAARRDGAIVMYDNQLTEVARWAFTEAWPSVLVVPVNADPSDPVVYEQVTIVVEGLARVP